MSDDLIHSPQALEPLAQHFLDPVDRVFNRIQAKAGRSWPLVVVLLAVILSFALRAPRYSEMVAFPATPYGQALTWWLDHPFVPVPVAQFFPAATLGVDNNSGKASHCDKLAPRATLPLLNQILGGGVWTLIIASNVAAILIFWFAYQIVVRDTKDPLSATLVTLALAGCYTGRYGFQDYICGDAVAIAFLMGAMWARPFWLIMTLAFLAGLTDERAIIAAPLVGLYQAWKAGGFAETLQKWPPGLIFWRAFAPILAALFLYLLFRAFAFSAGKVHTGDSMLATMGIFMCGFDEAPPVRMVDTFAGLWLIPLLFILSLWAEKGWRCPWLWSYLVLMALAIGPAFLVLDFARSLCYSLPGLMLTICLLPFGLVEKRRALGIALVASLLWSIPGSFALAMVPEHILNLVSHTIHHLRHVSP